MSSPILLDTTVLIDTLRNRNQRRKFLAGLVAAGRTLAISTLSIAEVYSGVRSGEDQATSALLTNLNWVPVSGAIAERAGRMKASMRSQGQTRNLSDMIIAATAFENACAIATDNIKDFQALGLAFIDLP
jgi:predicted nucleic acid-binding protein